MEQPIAITRGRTVPIELTVTDENGSPYAVASGEKILFGIKKDPDRDAAPIFVKSAAAGDDPGTYLVTIHPDDTLNLAPGRYYYDAGLETGGDYFEIIPPSAFLLRANVTAKGDIYA